MNRFVCDIKDLSLDGMYYDCVYGNWTGCYMTDEDFREFLKKMYVTLSCENFNGVLILKETTRREDDVFNTFDPRQNMYIRTKEEYL